MCLALSGLKRSIRHQTQGFALGCRISPRWGTPVPPTRSCGLGSSHRFWRRSSIVLALLLTSAASYAAEGTAAFRLYKDVNRDAVPDEAILAITLDSDIFAATRDEFPDLRIVDDTGAEAPYVTEKFTENRIQTSRQSIQSRVVSLHESGGNQIEVIIRLHDKAPAADGFAILTPLKDYERRVRVFGSEDGQKWVPLVADTLVFDYSRYMDVRNGDVPLPKNTHRQFKVAIDDVTEERQSPYRNLTRKFRGGEEQERIESTSLNLRPFRIDRLGFWHTVTSTQAKSDKKTEYPIVEFRTEEDAKTKSTIIHVRTRREPLTELTLVTDSRNFSRPAVVEIPVVHGVQTNWVQTGQATISLTDFADVHREELTITFPEQRQENYRITIANQDNPPISITAVKAQGNTYHAKFLASKDRKYQVYYGSETAKAPRYDTATVFASMREGYQPVDVQLADQVANPAFDRDADFAFGRFLENKLVFGGVIAVMVVVLGWILFRAGRKVSETPWE